MNFVDYIVYRQPAIGLGHHLSHKSLNTSS